MCSLHEDISGNIEALLRSLASTHREVLDFGCGVGGYLRFLSQTFGEVTAADTSRVCVMQAAAACRPLANVRVLTVQALQRTCRAPAFDVVLMANVLLSPEASVRRHILNQALANLRPGGALVLVVPALESVQLAEAVRRRYWPRRRSAYSVPLVQSGFDPGVIRIHGQATKHHAAAELGFELTQAGLEPVEVVRAEYSWASEGFETLDAQLEERPWDWLVHARRPVDPGEIPQS